MTDLSTDHTTEEINRLVKMGLTTITAMRIVVGELKEDFEVAQLETDRRAEVWAKLQENRELSIVPKWGHDPRHYYLSMDGNTLPSEINPGDFAIMCANAEDVVSYLHSRSTRTEGPWSREYRERTACIAYRWAMGMPVTPPLIAPVQGKIFIVGGTHRFHLARHYRSTRMPFLVRRSDLNSLPAKLQSTQCEEV